MEKPCVILLAHPSRKDHLAQGRKTERRKTRMQVGIFINCLEAIFTPCQPPVVSHDLDSWQGVRMDAQAFFRAWTQ